MEISRELFDQIKKYQLGPSVMNRGHEDIIDSVDFDLMNDCEDFVDQVFPDGLFDEDEYDWDNPDQDDVLEFFQETLDDPWFRMDKYRKDKKLSLSEVPEFRDFMINKPIPDYESEEGMFIYKGKLTCESDCLYVYTERQGHSWEGVRVSLLGIFESDKECMKVLFDQ